MKIILYIGVGGFLGAISRYGLSNAVQLFAGDRIVGFPLGTLAVNMIGCFVLGFVAHLLSERFFIARELRFAITVGFLGAFTTFSTFALETVSLAQGGRVLFAGLNLLAGNMLGLLFVWCGWRLGTLI